MTVKSQYSYMGMGFLTTALLQKTEKRRFGTQVMGMTFR